jgi:hypothetical protein
MVVQINQRMRTLTSPRPFALQRLGPCLGALLVPAWEVEAVTFTNATLIPSFNPNSDGKAGAE